MSRIIRHFLWVFICLIVIYLLGVKIFDLRYSRPVEVQAQPSGLNPEALREALDRANRKTVRILVVSGGGVSGILPLVYLNYMEQESHKPISELFDLFSGTSTGAIIVSILNIPNAEGRPRFSVQDILNFYQQFSKEVMKKNLMRQFFTLNGLLGPKFDVNDLHRNLSNIIGTVVKVHDLSNDVMLTVFNANTAKTQFVTSWEKESPFYKYPLADVLTAAGAAPMFFSSVQFNQFDGQESQSFMDNAIISNNPFPYVLSRAIQLYPNAQQYIVVYLDTGNFKIRTLKLSHHAYYKWGIIQWAPFLIQILFESQKKQIHEGINNLMLLLPEERFSYHYFGVDKYFEAFDSSDENIMDIKASTLKELEKNKPDIQALLKQLIQTQ